MDNLKPCPFCGKRVEISQSYLSFRYFIQCEDCCSTVAYDTKEEISKFWNTRPAEEALKAEVENMKKKLENVKKHLIIHRDHSIQSYRQDGKAYQAMNEFMTIFCNGLLELINTDTEKGGGMNSNSNTSKYACPKCGNPNIQTERRPDGFHRCMNCLYSWKHGKEVKPTLFDRLTASPEVLAPQFVYHVTSFLDGFDKPKKIWYSTLIQGRAFASETEAKRATAARLKEVCDE